MSTVSSPEVPAVAYRGEIDGLRAISVLLIIFFHIDIPGFLGGFVGVDVFFVISGFLITNIILQDLEGGHFSFRRFYLRRIARILPALIVTIALSLMMAAVLLPPEALVHSSKQGLTALLSVSNIFFWMESNYWAPQAKDYLLLHTWSLGVEEQFYLVYPLLLFFFYHFFARKGALFFLLVVFFGGLAASSFSLDRDITAGFYFAPLRFYEFALGGLGSLLSTAYLHKRLPCILPSLGSLAGLALILYSARTFSFFTLFPGTNALWPTTGALLVILAGQSVIAQALLANTLMKWIGKISYSLYLVHWPVIVLYRYCFGSSHSYIDQLILLLLTFLLGALLNMGVEKRFRLTSGDRASLAGMSARRVMSAIALSTTLVSGLAAAAIVGGGWPQRFPDNVQAFLGQEMRSSARQKRLLVEEHCVPRGEVFCGERQQGAEKIMLLADSRGLDIYIALQSAYPGANIYLSYAMGCAPVFDPNIGTSKFFRNCPDFNKQRLGAALDEPVGRIVFLAMDFTSWRSRFVVDTARRLAQSGKRVYVLGQSRFLRDKSPQQIAVDQGRFFAGSNYTERFLEPNLFRLDEQYGRQIESVGATYISTRDFFYQGEYRLFTRDGGHLLSYDGTHLSEAGAREFGQYMAERYPLGEPSPR